MTVTTNAIEALIAYGKNAGLIEQADTVYTRNALLECLALDEPNAVSVPVGAPLHVVLDSLCADAATRGVIEDGSCAHDLFDTKLMGVLTPRPSEVIAQFEKNYADAPEKATQAYYEFSQNTNYIRRDRIAKDLKWGTPTEYGTLQMTINLSKPEKDPKAIAAAGKKTHSGYPSCLLCRENEGYAGRTDHPARQNHRVIPLDLAGARWYMQYSPYVYYNEHCIVFNERHTPMKIDRSAFDRLLDFTAQFPHYFIGSNADLPIVGGSILSHDHFQGGHHRFPMEEAGAQERIVFETYTDVQAQIVNWPMSVIRLTGADPKRVSACADAVLAAWRSYSDPEIGLLSHTSGTPHNTITPIARRRGQNYELDLVLRNNRTTQQYPLGLFHPHEEYHHIKKENIGLIEVMGLAVLPARLKTELAGVRDALIAGTDIDEASPLGAHAQWARQLAKRYPELVGMDLKQADDIVKKETGLVFEQVLEDAGIYKHTPTGKDAFRRFIAFVNTRIALEKTGEAAV